MESILENCSAVIVLNSERDGLDDAVAFKDSLSEIGINCLIFVTCELGYHRNNVISLFDYFLIHDLSSEKLCPYQVELDDHYALSCCTNGDSWIYDDHKVDVSAGYIRVDKNHRLEKVNYYSKPGLIKSEDFYNEYGRLQHRDLYDKDKKLIIRTYFDDEGREIIVENWRNAHIKLLDNGKYHFFNWRGDFAVYLLKKLGFKNQPIMFTSFNPLNKAICSAFDSDNNILFYPSSKEVFENIAEEFHCKHVISDKKIDMNVDRLNLIHLSRLYEQNYENKQSLSCIMYVGHNSFIRAQRLVKNLPYLDFSIIIQEEDVLNAVNLGAFENVTIYQTDLYLRLSDIVTQLSKTCSIVINLDGLLDGFMEELFISGQVLFTLSNEISGSKFVLSSHKCQTVGKLIKEMLLIKSTKDGLQRDLQKQYDSVCFSNFEDYKQFAALLKSGRKDE